MKQADKDLREIISRLEKLEHAVFGSGRKAASMAPTDTKKYKGATGGIRLLVDEGFFDKKHSFGEICKALEGKGYHYTKQAVQTPLNNLSSSGGGILVALTEKGRKLYAKRK
ncbi:MAG: hypothetical protein HY207_11010 [Nitrospirae bacterium]|nr:hypothetical protein [Nitrospirota bacterium]